MRCLIGGAQFDVLRGDFLGAAQLGESVQNWNKHSHPLGRRAPCQEDNSLWKSNPISAKAEISCGQNSLELV